MKKLLTATALVTLASPLMAETIGVSIPAATHGWAGGLNYHAQATVDRLSEQYPDLEFVLTTASDPSKQVSDIEDMVATRNIDALVVLPFESEPLTPTVARVRKRANGSPSLTAACPKKASRICMSRATTKASAVLRANTSRRRCPMAARSSSCAASHPPSTTSGTRLSTPRSKGPTSRSLAANSATGTAIPRSP